MLRSPCVILPDNLYAGILPVVLASLIEVGMFESNQLGTEEDGWTLEVFDHLLVWLTSDSIIGRYCGARESSLISLVVSRITSYFGSLYICSCRTIKSHAHAVNVTAIM